MKTPPILFLIFNRPETTVRSFAAIRAARPEQLFIAADAPRTNRPGEVERCAATRAITENVDWPCDVHRLYRTENLGCGRAVTGALKWFFENIEEGIIIEDDIVPEPTFFPYCATLLERYRTDERIMSIAGYNPLSHGLGDGDYYASPFSQIWGWATWRRAIAHFDFEMTRYPAFKAAGRFSETMLESRHIEHFEREFDLYAEAKINNWDHQWMFSMLDRRGRCLIPCVNLVKNIGFGPDSTFAANSASYHARRKSAPIHLPPRAPSSLTTTLRQNAELLDKANNLSRFHLFLSKIAAPFTPTILKIIWCFHRLVANQ